MRLETLLFHNENGSEVFLTALLDDEQVSMIMKGPDSTMTNVVTRREAEELHTMLGKVLGHDDAA